MKVGAPSFSSGAVSSVVLVTYILFLFLVFWNDTLPDVPKDQKGLSLKNAYTDLHHIAERPHPYNSHANDYVRSYILSKVRSIERQFPSHVQVIDDLKSNGSWASSSQYGVYFEGTNILVKIEGTKDKFKDKGGVLFSAHYDSVSTAPGATDDGMGVATLIQLVEYFAKNRMKRTAVFNINNGEEDWLNGAHAFLQHPWSRIPDSFLNLEGAASGGRPILFRATSSAILRSFKSRHVSHPHANVLSSDAFSRGIIRSGTDYSVYVDGASMQGLDFAFYKGRSKYHTKYDAIPFTDGKERSLWAMLDSARGAGEALLGVDEKTHDSERYVPAVYFDLFASRLVLFPLDTLYIFNILFLILGPILLVGLLFVQAVIKASSKRPHEQQHHDHDHHHHNRPSFLTRIFTDFRLIWRWAKFWVAIVATVGVQALVIFVFVKANPYIIYSNPYTVLFCFTILSFLTFTWTLTSDLPAPSPSSPYYNSDLVESLPESQKDTVLLQSYTLSWILLLLSTIAIGKAKVGGVYVVTFWSVGVWVACAVGSLETVFSVRSDPRGFKRLSSNSRERGRSESSDGSGYGRTRDREREPTERSPLNRPDRGQALYTSPHTPHTPTHPQQHASGSNSNSNSGSGSNGESGQRERGRSKAKQCEDEEGCIDWWLFQFIMTVPAPLVLTAHIANMVLDATSQTLADGNSKVGVYTTTSLLSFLLILPLAPFSFRIHKSIGWMLLVFFVLWGFWALFWAFPFDMETPLKVYFMQSVEVVGAVSVLGSSAGLRGIGPSAGIAGSASGLVPASGFVANQGQTQVYGQMIIEVKTSLYGVSEYLRNDIVAKLPSAQYPDRPVECERSHVKLGLVGCSWRVEGWEMMPRPGSSNDFKATRSAVNGTMGSEVDLKIDNMNTDASTRDVPQFFKASFERTSTTSAQLTLRGTNTRNCRVYFTNRPIIRYTVSGSVPAMQHAYPIPASGINELRLWSRTWDKEFVVDLEWRDEYVPGAGEGLKGKVACEWAEYASAAAGVPGESASKVRGGWRSAKIPSLEEVLAFLPTWVAVTKFADGLVEVWENFEV